MILLENNSSVVFFNKSLVLPVLDHKSATTLQIDSNKVSKTWFPYNHYDRLDRCDAKTILAIATIRIAGVVHGDPNDHNDYMETRLNSKLMPNLCNYMTTMTLKATAPPLMSCKMGHNFLRHSVCRKVGKSNFAVTKTESNVKYFLNARFDENLHYNKYIMKYID